MNNIYEFIWLEGTNPFWIPSSTRASQATEITSDFSAQGPKKPGVLLFFFWIKAQRCIKAGARANVFCFFTHACLIYNRAPTKSPLYSCQFYLADYLYFLKSNPELLFSSLFVHYKFSKFKKKSEVNKD